MRFQSFDVMTLQESPCRTREAILVPTPSSGRRVCSPDVPGHSSVSLREAVSVSTLQPLTLQCTGIESCALFH